MKRIAVLITCHNRRTTTLACLAALFANNLPQGVVVDVVLVDDGSTDGTEALVRERYPRVEILRGDGNLFWNRGMHLAFAHAMLIGFDGYLWLNDDTLLSSKSFELLLSALDSATPENVIVVGCVQDPISDEMTYGGVRLINSKIRPFMAMPVYPGSVPKDVDVFNGNVVLIPDEIARKLGNLDPVFEHGMGDTDYAMRSRRLGIRILLTAGYVGTCSRNSIKITYRDKALSLHERFRHVFSRKGLPWRSWLIMCWRHGGTLWPIHFVWAYVKVLLGRS